MLHSAIPVFTPAYQSLTLLTSIAAQPLKPNLPILKIDLLYEIQRTKELVEIFTASYFLSHTLPAAIILVLIIYGIVYLRKRRSINVEPFMIAMACLLLLMAFNLVRDVIQLFVPAVYGFALVDLITIGVTVYTFYTFLNFVKVARQYRTPLQIDLLTKEKLEATLISQLHVHSAWVTHEDLDNLTLGLAKEIRKGDNDKLGEISRRLEAFADFGRDQLSENYPLEKAFQKAKDDLSAEIEARNLEVLNEELPVVSCYPEQMEYLFRELISNVIKHNDEAEPTLVVYVEEQPEDWILILEDNGEGIILRDRAQLFNLFRLDDENNIDLRQGMGLALCRKVMRNHRGHIWMESDYFAGVTIYLAIPKELILNPRYIPEY